MKESPSIFDKPLLVTGANGMLGWALRQRLIWPDGPKGELLWTDVRELDITDRAAVGEFVGRRRPGVILNCAALTDVDGCESRRDEAFRINGAGVENLARAAAEAGCLLVQLSTDFVFSGDARRPYREDDEPRPLSVYAASKLAGEKAAELAPQRLIVRTAWLYGPRGKNFVRAICQRADEAAPLRVVGDQVGSPTYSRDLAEALWRLIRSGARGVVHAVGSETASWFGFAKAIVELWRPGTLVAEITSQELQRPARRPAYSVLDCSRLLAIAGYRLPGFSQALPQYLAELRAELQGAAPA